MVQEHNKEIFIWKTRVFQFHLCQEKTGTEKVWFGHAFWCRVTNFKPHLLSPQKSKLKNFSAHQQEDFLRISKLTLLLFLVPILKELWQFWTSWLFFGTPSSVCHRCCEKFVAKINAKFSQLSWYYVAKKCDNKRDIAFFCTFYKYRDGTPSKKLWFALSTTTSKSLLELRCS